MQKVIQRQSVAYDLVREHMKRLAVRTKKHYDSKVKDVVFHVGDWVWVYSPRRYIGRSPKWSEQYGGPFLIEKVINAVNYVVRRSKRAQPIIVHVDKIKKCLGATPPSWLESEQEENQSVVDECEPNNSEPMDAESVEPTTGPVPTGTDTATRRGTELDVTTDAGAVPVRRNPERQRRKPRRFR